MNYRQIANYSPNGSAVAATSYDHALATDMSSPGGALSGMGQMTMQQKHVALVAVSFLVGAYFASRTKTGRRLWRKSY